MPTVKQIEAARRMLEDNGYVVSDRPDAEWDFAAKAYREAYYKTNEELNGRAYFQSFEKARPCIIAGLKAAMPFVPDED